MVKIHHIKHSGANTGYHTTVLNKMRKYDDISVVTTRLDEYKKNINADVLLYQTFPDEKFEAKFNPRLVEQTDKLFHEFSGLKILADCHDNGELDSFTRFDDPSIPRLKCFPSKWFMEHYNVVLISTFSNRSYEVFEDDRPRDKLISCKFGNVGNFYFHRVRESVREQLENHFGNVTDFERVPGREAYLEDLRSTLISVCAPGWGQYSGNHQCSLRAGALLMAYKCIEDIIYLPHAGLADGVNFVSYDLFNFRTKLERLLNDREKVESIRRAGRMYFKIGYDPVKSASDWRWKIKDMLL